MRIVELYRSPYPLNPDKKVLQMALFVAGFVTFFLMFFQPFGLRIEVFTTLLRICLIYGLITFAAMAFNAVVLRKVFPVFFSENSWTLGKEMILVMVNFLLVGFLNLLYSNWQFKIGLSYRDFAVFQLYTFGVGFFPVLFFLMVKHNKLLHKNEQVANDLSTNLNKMHEVKIASHQKIIIPSDLKSDDLILDLEDFIYSESADNYVLIHHIVNGQRKKTLVRCTMARLESAFSNYPMVIRCHRAYLVNLDKIENFKGNAQGLRLQLSKVEEEVAVSRTMVPKIRELIH